MPVFITTFQAVAPYLDSVAAILMMGIISLVIAGANKDKKIENQEKKIEEIVKAHVAGLMDEINHLKRGMEDCHNEKAALSHRLDIQQREIDDLRRENTSLRESMLHLHPTVKKLTIKN